ncbi:serine/threonine-protein phosphatase 4 regulatory subunit 2-B-like [Takifugu rubripes]|uniref:Serine/threonine-protein phosphatase 4 regulatory subunit 2-B-like n=1 Tax=Takifugu rubripes TaxID=31033 RepID=H2TYG9_TAKRU|nr:serine/threonine-protein phosphatase 4 regulatory subunit 2-B-like [Takifugu rubripes]
MGTNMEIHTLLEAFQEFENKDKKEACPVLEQFLCHIAKTGQPVLPWSQFKTYFMFKLEKVMDGFCASAPQQRGQQNPNVDYVPYEQMKGRILKIVDDFHGIPFTIQRLCELLTDPKRNYTGIDKFLLGLEKNVMVVSCISSTSEKNRSPGVNRMNGVMSPSNYSDSRNVNGPPTQNLLNRPKISSCDSCSRNGFPDSPGNQKPVLNRDELKENFNSESSPVGGGIMSNSGLKKRQSEQGADDEKQQIKRLKFDENREGGLELKGTACKQSENLESSEGTSGQESKNVTPKDRSSIQEGFSQEKEISCETRLHTVESEDSADQQDQPASPVTSSSFEHHTVESSHTSDGKDLPCDFLVPSTSSSTDPSTEGDTDNSDSAKTAEEPVDKM